MLWECVIKLWIWYYVILVFSGNMGWVTSGLARSGRGTSWVGNVEGYIRVGYIRARVMSGLGW